MAVLLCYPLLFLVHEDELELGFLRALVEVHDGLDGLEEAVLWFFSKFVPYCSIPVFT